MDEGIGYKPMRRTKWSEIKQHEKLVQLQNWSDWICFGLVTKITTRMREAYGGMEASGHFEQIDHHIKNNKHTSQRLSSIINSSITWYTLISNH